MAYSTSSIVLLPEQGDKAYIQQHSWVQKRRSGRKPKYTTAEERKQRNRQAQAAFRERRTAYINQSGSIIKQLWEELQELQNQQRSHRDAAYECHMLRYKNSRLERILLEKGIDVHAELRASAGNYNLNLARSHGSLNAPPRSISNGECVYGPEVVKTQELVPTAALGSFNDKAQRQQYLQPQQLPQQPGMTDPSETTLFSLQVASKLTETNGAGAVFDTMDYLFNPYNQSSNIGPLGISTSIHMPAQFPCCFMG